MTPPITPTLLALTITLNTTPTPTTSDNDPLASQAHNAITFLTHTLTDDNPDPHDGTGYTGNRTTLYGEAWLDTDNNGCDTRNDILTRDLTNADYSPQPGTQPLNQGTGEGVSSCPDATVYAGTLHDPYTDTTINFTRGHNTSQRIQIDHIIPLSYAYTHGGWAIAQQGNKDLMIRFANDPLNLIAVDGTANSSKSDSRTVPMAPTKPELPLRIRRQNQ